MTREQFLARLKALSLRQADFHRQTGVSPGTVYHWGGAGGPFPPWVSTLLNAWEDNKRKHDQIRSITHGQNALGQAPAPYASGISSQANL